MFIKKRKSFAKSIELFDRAKKSIPLATQTFSKSYLQWPKGLSPLFFERGKGCYVHDVDGNKYIDYLLALMPIVLGYSDPDIDRYVKKQMKQGVVLSMPHPIELELAEKLISIIPYAEMVRFGKNGSDALTAAVRLARAHTKRDRVLFSGYHGWHDWYIGSTTRDLGVPKDVKKLSSKFIFNDIESLHRELKKHSYNYAALIIEPDGINLTSVDFLKEVRRVCDKYGIVLVFDEIVCGFRTALGGASEVFGVNADIGCFGKALANGYPISALVGRREIMSSMEKIFVSGTFAGETLSIAAAIATISKLEKHDVPNKLRNLGAKLTKLTNKIIIKEKMDGNIIFGGNNWWPRLNIKDIPVSQEVFMTILRKELINNGLFIGSGFNLCLAHDNPVVIKSTLLAFEKTIKSVKNILNSNDPYSFVKGQLIKPVFNVR